MSEDEDDDDEEEDDGIGDEVPVIVDNGTGMVKAGLGSDDAPKHIFPEMIGLPREPYKAQHTKSHYFGDEFFDNLNHFMVRSPMENGIIQNFEDMEKIWEHTFFEMLDVNPMQHPLILTEPPYNPKPNREKVVEIMFETFGVPSLNISVAGVLALLGHGRTSGLVLGAGDGVTATIPIFDGYGLIHCINRSELAGKDITSVLGKLLALQGKSLVKSNEWQHVAKMKEQHCYVSQDPSAENAEPVTYTLPDKREITLKDERWQACEPLFSPGVGGLDSEAMGVATMVWDTISRCELDTRRTLLSNIVLSGGSTMFPGFSERLTKELRAVAPSKVQASIKVAKSKNAQNAVWVGGQIFASLRAMQEDQWVSTEDYDEYGAGYIHEKIAVKYK